MEKLERHLRNASPCLRFEGMVFGAWLVGFIVTNALMVSRATFVTFLATDSILIGFLYLLLRSVRRVCLRDAVSIQAALKRFAFLLLAALGLGVLLEAGTVFGDPLHSVRDLGSWSARRILIFACLSYCALALLWEAWPRIKGSRIRLSRTEIRWLLCSVAGGIVIVVALAGLLIARCDIIPYAAILFSICVAGCLAGLVMAYRFCPRVEAMFAAIALALGFTIAVIYPATTHLAMDDEVHYRSAIATSYLDEPSYSYSDELLVDRPDHPEIWSVVIYPPFIESGIAVTSAEVDMYNERMDAGYAESASPSSGLASIEGSSVLLRSFDALAYIPNAVGLWIGRFMHLPFHWIFIAGRMTALLFYVFMGILSIRIIPTKKVLLASVALIPTCVFMAASYTRDAWMFEFSLLGTALLVRLLCCSRKINCRDLIPIIVAYFLAIAIKPVYAPLLLLLFLVRRRKFASKAQWRLFVSAVLAATLLLVSSFALPFLLWGTGGNDMRGGSDINSAAQIAYILNNPIEYAFMLIRYMVHYLDPARSYGYLLSFGNLGVLGENRYAFIAVVPLMLLITVALLDADRRSNSLCFWRERLVAFISFAASLILVITSLYVAFTGVGASTVSGVQGRYVLPLLPPLLVFVFNVRIRNLIEGRRFALFFVSAFGVLGFLASFLLVVRPLVI